MIMIIKNARLILPDRVVCGSAEFDGDRIVRVTEGDHSVSPGEVLDANGMYLCPGFVDIHTHGGGGVDFMDETSHDDALNFHAKNGTTSIIPTAITAPPALLRKFAQRVRAEKEKQATGIFTGASRSEVYSPKTFFLHAALLGQSFLHCPIFLTAASRRSLDRISVPVWPVILSDRLIIVALVGLYPHQLANDTQAHLLPDLTPLTPLGCPNVVLCGISSRFQLLSPCDRQITHALLTSPPLR